MLTVRGGTRAGFTLVELLVVIAIIGVLVGMLVPAVQFSREAGRRAQCLSNLHQIFVALDQYVDVQGSRGRFPDCAHLPSLDAARPSLAKALATYIETNTTVFACPDDMLPDDAIVMSMPGIDTYFKREGVSYEYDATRRLVRPVFQADGKTVIYTRQTRQEAVTTSIRNQKTYKDATDAERRRSRAYRGGVGVSSATVVVANDFDPFHVVNPFGTSTGYDDQVQEDAGIRCFVYLDGHADGS